MPNADDVAHNLEAVTTRIQTAREQYAATSSQVRLIAVSKTFGPDRILPALNAGHRCFGENRVQESKQKWPALKARFPDTELHLIGPLQSNKVKDAVDLFDWIHSLDRMSLARALAKEQEKSGNLPKLLIQVNTGQEQQKAGIDPQEVDAFFHRCRDELGLEISGLMCIPPIAEEPSLHFALLRKISERLDLPELSMGMSGDFETAVELGATMVRVGSAIFGERAKTD